MTACEFRGAIGDFLARPVALTAGQKWEILQDTLRGCGPESTFR
jgi:hypothetical protein